MEKRQALRKHEPTLRKDVVLAGIGFLLMYLSTYLVVTQDSRFDRNEISIGGFILIGFSLLFLFGVGANIATSPQWSRSYPLIPIYFAGITITFAKLYALFGMVDQGKATHDYATALYFSLSTIANLGLSDVTTTTDGRFIAITEGLIGYVALAFLAALLFTTMQRGMRRQLKLYNRRRLLLLGSRTESGAAPPAPEPSKPEKQE